MVALLLIAVPVVYVLSYAPVVRICRRTIPTGFDSGYTPTADGSLYPMYKPVDWLIDNTPLHDPLFSWAEICGVREDFEMGEFIRSWDER
jgi:hypothetical protein